MPAPLTNRQKRYLAMLCRRAFERQADIARRRGETWEHEEDAWRHDQVARAVGKLGLRCCGQMDYKQVEAAFLDLIGDSGRAFRAAVSAQTEPRRQAEAVLAANLAKFGLRPGYAEAICRQVFKCSMLDASTNQIWAIIYTIRTRGIGRQRKERNQCKSPSTHPF